MFSAIERWRNASPSRALISAEEVTDSSTGALRMLVERPILGQSSSDPCSVWTIATAGARRNRECSPLDVEVDGDVVPSAGNAAQRSDLARHVGARRGESADHELLSGEDRFCASPELVGDRAGRRLE